MTVFHPFEVPLCFSVISTASSSTPATASVRLARFADCAKEEGASDESRRESDKCRRMESVSSEAGNRGAA